MLSTSFLLCLCDLTIAKVSYIQIHIGGNTWYASLISILPHSEVPRIFRHICLRTAILCYPDTVCQLQCICIPKSIIHQLISGCIEHSCVSICLCFLQKCICDSRAFVNREPVLPTGAVLKAFTVIYHRIGNRISCQQITHPLCFFLRFCCGYGCREKVCAQLNSIGIRFLQVIPCAGIFPDLSTAKRPITTTDHSEFHTRIRHLFPVNRSLKFRHINTNGSLISLTGNLLYCTDSYFFSVLLRFI